MQSRVLVRDGEILVEAKCGERVEERGEKKRAMGELSRIFKVD